MQTVEISVTNTETGDVRVSIVDRSAAVRDAFGGSAHFHEVTVRAADKDALLAALLSDRFSDAKPFGGESEYEEWLRGKGIEPVVDCEVENE